MFITELWYEVRPYALHIAIDLMVSLLLRIEVWYFHLIEHFMPIGGWVDDFLNNLHALGTVASLGVIIGLSLRDIWRFGKHREN